MDRALHVQRCMRAEDPPGWIEQKEIGTGNGGGNLPVHLSRLTAGYAADDIANGGGAGECCGFPVSDIERRKAMKQVGANLLAKASADGETGSQEAAGGTNRAIRADLSGGRAEQDQCAGCDGEQQPE